MHIKSVSAGLALALLSTAAVLPSAAMAADLPSRRAPPVYIPPPVPTFTWTGLYIGGQVGYEFGKSRSTIFNTATGAGVGAGSSSPDGVIGGAHIGYLYSTQSLPFGGLLGAGGVIGLEGDVDGSNARKTYGVGAFTATSSDDIQGSVRGRLGVAVDRVLFYATGGAAFGGLTNRYTDGANVDSFNHTKVGWTAGGGVEYAINNNWSARVEYRYTDYGRVTDVLANTAPANSVTRHETDSRVQAGFSYKFDTFSPIAPVVARY